MTDQILSTTFEASLEFINADDGEAFASVSYNPTFRWCKFILTDDKPNLNKHRIPVEEFDNLIRTGLYAPIKMASGQINEGHNESLPLGTITALKKEGNLIKGLAALWSLERETDVDMLKTLYDSGKPLNLSWEVLYRSTEAEAEGVTALKDTVLRATTLVGMPAYGGRTPILQVASIDQNSEGNKLNLEELQAKFEELEQKYQEQALAIEALLTEKKALETEVATLKEENIALAQFKTDIEEKRAIAEKLASIKQKFVDNGISKPESYFDDNKDLLLGMDETALGFMLQEIVAFASISAKHSESSTVEIPVITQTIERLSPKDLARKLR